MENDQAPPVMKKIENAEEFLKQIKECLLYSDEKGLKTYILEHKFSNTDLYWELTSELTKHITKETSEKTPGFFEACERCLAYFVRTGNPKEMLLALLEQADTFNDDVKYKTLIHLIQKTLLQLPRKRFHSLDISLETLSAHVQLLPLPEEGNLEGKERLILDTDENVQRICDILDEFLKFIKPFAEDVSVDKGRDETIQSNAQVFVLKKHLLQVLDHPLIHLDLSYDISISKTKSKSRRLAERAMELLTHLESDFHKLMQVFLREEGLKMIDDAESTEEEEEEKEERKAGGEAVQDDMDFQNKQNEAIEMKKHKDKSSDASSKSSHKRKDKVENWKFQKKIPKLSMSCLAYLVHVEHLGIEKMPSVYTHEHNFSFCLPFILPLVETTESLLVYKGLHLLRVLIGLIPQESVSISLQDNESFSPILNCLNTIMVMCPLKELRQCAVKILPRLIAIFDDKGKYGVFKTIFASCSHSGVLGYTVQLLKDEIHRTLQQKIPSPFFTGSQLEKLMKMVMVLPDGAATDLVEHSDCIIAVLNLLRFLVLRDQPQEDVTGVWRKFEIIEKQYLNPIRTGLEMSKAHYKLELNNVKEGKRNKAESEVEFSVSVAGKPLSAMSKEERVQVLERALNTFDLISSLLGRLSELKDQVLTTSKLQKI